MSLLGRIGAYIRHNRRSIVRDLLVAAVWVLVLQLVIAVTGWSTTIYYILLFGGLIVYASLVPAWERPREID